MPIMLPSAKRKDGEEQPGIHFGMFCLRIPLVHCEWEIPETVQAAVCFVTGVSATAYLMNLFGLTFGTALSIVVVHELLYLIQNLIGDPIIGGWITPSIPITSAWLVGFSWDVVQKADGTGIEQIIDNERVQALVALQLELGILFVVLGFTGLAGKLVDWTPNSVKSGILMGSGIASVIGSYGFQQGYLSTGTKVGLMNAWHDFTDDSVLNLSSWDTELAEGVTYAVKPGYFYQNPIVFCIGVLLAMWCLFGHSFIDIRDKGNKVFGFLSTLGFVPALVIAFVVGVIIKSLPSPTFDKPGVIFNPFSPYSSDPAMATDGLPWVWQNFSLIGIGIPSAGVLVAAIPMALICYVIAFGDIVAATEFLMDTRRYRRDELIPVSANRTNACCGIRNILQGLFFPTVVTSGPLWSAMMVTCAERYKTGKKNMYSIFGGVITFNLIKVVCCFIIPLTAIITPILPLSMSITLEIQAFGCFYVAFGMANTTQERGVAGMVGCILAVAGPAYGLISGIICAIIVQARSKKMAAEAEARNAARLAEFERILAEQNPDGESTENKEA